MVKSPYIITIFVFSAILIAGRWFWYWGEMETAFLLLFFLLVTIGIRLDDIIKKIGSTNERLDRLIKNSDRCQAPLRNAGSTEGEKDVKSENKGQ